MHAFNWWQTLLLDIITSPFTWYFLLFLVVYAVAYVVRKIRRRRKKILSQFEPVKVVNLAPEFKDSQSKRN